MAGSRSLGSLTLDLVLKLAGFKEGINSSERELERLNKKAEAFGRGLGRAITIGTGIAITALTLYVKNSIAAEKVQAQLASRIKDTAGIAGRSLEQLNARAEQLQQLTVFDDEQIGSVQAMLLTFKNIQGINFDKATASVLDLSTVLGTDAETAAKQLGKALNDPIKGIDGLSRAGIQFSEDQKKLIKSLVETGDVAGAQDVILKELEGRMGTAAEAARDTLGGALQALKNSFHDLLKGDAGNDGLQGARDAVENLNTTLNDPGVREGFQSLIRGALTAIGALAKFVSATASTSKFLGEELAARVHGAAIGDRARLDDQLNRLKKDRDDLLGKNGKLTGAFNLLLGGRSGQVGYFGGPDKQLANLDAEIKKTNEKIAVTDDLAASVTKLKAIEAPKIDTSGVTVPNVPALGGVPKPSGGGGGKSDLTRNSEESARAIEQMVQAQQQWQDELSQTGNPIVDDYNSRLADLDEQAKGFAKDGVDTTTLEAWNKKMKELAESHYAKDLAAFQEDFNKQTAETAAQLAGPTAEALQTYGEDLAKIDDLLATHQINLESYNARKDQLLIARDSPFASLNQDLEEQINLLGMTANQQEIYNNLLRLGTTATEADKQAIIARTEELQKMREQVAFMDELKAGLSNMFVDFVSGAKTAKEAFGDFADAIYARALQFVADKAINALFDAFKSIGSSGGSSNTVSTSSWVDYLSLLGGARAMGGPVKGGQLYEVGEYNRPETFFTGGKQYLIPGNNGMIAAGAGGGTFSQVNNFILPSRISNKSEMQIAQAAGSRASSAIRRNNGR